MNLDLTLLVIVAVLLIARVGAGRAVPVGVFGLACATWALLLVARFAAAVLGALLRLSGMMPAAGYDYGYGPGPTFVAEAYGFVAISAYTLLGFGVVAVVMWAAVSAPIKEDRAVE